jgi:glycosyltransferase involved in cell wall biosynthesis
MENIVPPPRGDIVARVLALALSENESDPVFFQKNLKRRANSMITNEPAPYRIPTLNKMAKAPGIRFHALFCCEREPNRQWTLPPLQFDYTYLREHISTYKGRYIHNNIDVLPALNRLAPDVVITTGFNPTHLYSFAYALAKGIAHVSMTDGTFESELSLSSFHRQVRRAVYARSHAFIWAGLGGKKLYASYGIAESRSFQSCLCVDNAAYCRANEHDDHRFDFIFCGRIEPVKNPLFALELALEVARRLNRVVKILYVGAGAEEAALRRAAAVHADRVDVVLHGFASQSELPALYRSARIFLFPTSWDPWGVVANEACAAGLPVIVSPKAGVAGELVVDGQNGFVCDLDVGLWADRAVMLLTRTALYRAFSQASRAMVSHFTFDAASDGILAACKFASAERTRHRNITSAGSV